MDFDFSAPPKRRQGAEDTGNTGSPPPIPIVLCPVVRVTGDETPITPAYVFTSELLRH